MPASPFDLTTLDNVKAWLGNSGAASDDILQRSITNVSRFILSEIGRGNILPADYVDGYDGYGWAQSRIMLRNWPVISVAGVSIAGTNLSATNRYNAPNAASPPVNVTRNAGFLPSVWDGYPPGVQGFVDLFGYSIPRGPQESMVAYRAGYQYTETLTVPASGPYTVTPTAPFGRWASNEGVLLLPSLTIMTRVAANPQGGEYTVSAVGLYTFAASNAGASVQISYGYVPGDLEQAALEMISARFKSRESIGVNSKSLGGAETISYSKADMSEPVRTMLQPYRSVF